MLGIPDFLNQYTSAENQKGTHLSFKLKCTCGCETFSIIKNSYTADEMRLKKEYEEKITDVGWHTIYEGYDSNGKIYHYIKKFFFFKKYIEFLPLPLFMDINVVKAICSQCNKEIIVFDSRYHGYNSQFVTNDYKIYIPYFENSKAKTGIIIVDIEQFDEEDVAPEYFTSIQVSIKNRNKKHRFFDLETS